MRTITNINRKWAFTKQTTEIPAEIVAYRFTCALPIVRTVVVEQFCSWSA